MDKFGYSIIGLKELNTKLDRLVELSTEEAQKQVDGAANVIQDTAKKSISQGGRSGKSYTAGGKTGTRSAVGQFPKTDTGNLVNQITIENPSKLTARIGSTIDAPYGKWLEFGTSKMGARPWLARSFKINERKILKNIEYALKRIKL